MSCLDDAKKAYGDAFDHSEIEDIYSRLSEAKENAISGGSNIFDELQMLGKGAIKDRDFQLKAKKLQQISDVKALHDTVMRIKGLKGRNNPVYDGIFSKITGNESGQENARSSTSLRMSMADNEFKRQFYKDLKDNNLTAIWNSKDHQLEISEALLNIKKGGKGDTQFDKIAKIVTKYNNKMEAGYNKHGIFTPELEDRIAPNVWDQARMLKLTREERIAADGDRQKIFDTAFNKWKNFVYPDEKGSLFGNDRTFKDNTTDAERTEFLRHAFDSLVNGGKVGEDGVNFANRILRARVLHPKDGASLIKMNNQYGSGALQDSIMREFSGGFRRIEMMKDWGINPTSTFNRALQAVEKDPDLKFRIGKKNDITILKRLLSNLSGGQSGYAGSLDKLASNAISAMNIIKLGKVVLRVAGPDLASLSHEISQTIGGTGLKEAMQALGHVFYGASKKEMKQIADLLGIGHQHEYGSVGRYSSDLNYTNILAKGERLAFKINGLSGWDYGLRSFLASTLSRDMAFNRGKTFDQIGEKSQSILKQYGIGPQEWEAVRHSSTTLTGKKLFITPDSVQGVDEKYIKDILNSRGSKNITPDRIQEVRDEIESKMRMYFQDRADHVIQNPDVRDRDLAMWTRTKDSPWYSVMRLMSQFKQYGIAFMRKKLSPLVYGQGAETFRESLLAGKFDYKGMAGLITKMATGGYLAAAAGAMAEGNSPPGLNKIYTWIKMLSEPMGIAGVATEIPYTNAKDIMSYVANQAAGPTLSTAIQAATVPANAVADTVKGKGFKHTEKAVLNLIKNNLPGGNLPFVHWALNQFIYSKLEDDINPGGRRQRLNRIQHETGSTSLF